MKDELVAEVMQQMLPYLDNAQLKQLRQVMEHTLFHYDISDSTATPEEDDSETLVASFIAAKRIEGCSEKTLKYYQTTIDAMVTSLGKNVRHIFTEDLRGYLTKYQGKHQSSRVTIDNIRRILSSFFIMAGGRGLHHQKPGTPHSQGQNCQQYQGNLLRRGTGKNAG